MSWFSVPPLVWSFLPWVSAFCFTMFFHRGICFINIFQTHDGIFAYIFHLPHDNISSWWIIFVLFYFLKLTDGWRIFLDQLYAVVSWGRGGTPAHFQAWWLGGSFLAARGLPISLFSFFLSFLFLKIWNASQICMSSLHTGHANLCIVPILVYVLPKRSLYTSFLTDPQCLPDLTSPTRDRTCVPAVEAQSPNHWTTREAPPLLLTTAALCVFSVWPHFSVSPDCTGSRKTSETSLALASSFAFRSLMFAGRFWDLPLQDGFPHFLYFI